jgi:hypothetical protein
LVGNIITFYFPYCERPISKNCAIIFGYLDRTLKDKDFEEKRAYILT